jgi:hypothetical protein
VETGWQAALGAIAWSSLGLFLIGAVSGIPFLERRYRRALAILSVATLGGFVFSFIAGFSVGRFTALLPLVLTAFAVTYGRGLRLRLAAYATAVALYILLAWLIPERVGYWGIHIDLALCAIAYGIAFLRPPPAAARPNSTTRESVGRS